MAQLWELLEIEKGLTAVMGSGGKTGLLYELAEELRPYGTVLLATTTHIMRPPQYPFAATAADGVRAGRVRLRADHPSSGSPPCAVRRFGGGDGGHGHHPGAGGPGADGRGRF